MSMLSGHSIFDCSAGPGTGFGVYSDTDRDSLSIPSSQTLLTYPMALGSIPWYSGSSSSPHQVFNATLLQPPTEPFRHDYGDSSFDSSITGHFLSECTCQVLLSTAAYQKKASQARIDDEAPPAENRGLKERCMRPVAALDKLDERLIRRKKPSKNASFHDETVSSTSPSTTLKTTTTTASTEAKTDKKASHQVLSPQRQTLPMAARQSPPKKRLSLSSSNPSDVECQQHLKNNPPLELLARILDIANEKKNAKKTRILRNLRYPRVGEKKNCIAKVIGSVREGNTYKFQVRFAKCRAFYQIYCISEEAREYRLPIFRNLRTMLQMMKCKEYRAENPIEDDSEVTVIEGKDYYSVLLQRFESRLTLQQLAILLGLQCYSVHLTRHIEEVVVQMFHQLHELEITSEARWCKLDRALRQQMISRVHKFSQYYFPTISKDMLEIIMRRASYAKAQLKLKTDRLRRKSRYKVVETLNGDIWIEKSEH